MNTPSCASVPKKPKIKDFNSPRNKPLIVLDYWPKNTEEYFNLHNTDKINLYEKYTTQDMTNLMKSMMNHSTSMEQGTISIQEKFIELDNKRAKQSIRTYQLIRGNISTKKPST